MKKSTAKQLREEQKTQLSNRDLLRFSRPYSRPFSASSTQRSQLSHSFSQPSHTYAPSLNTSLPPSQPCQPDFVLSQHIPPSYPRLLAQNSQNRPMTFQAAPSGPFPMYHHQQHPQPLFHHQMQQFHGAESLSTISGYGTMAPSGGFEGSMLMDPRVLDVAKKIVASAAVVSHYFEELRQLAPELANGGDVPAVRSGLTSPVKAITNETGDDTRISSETQTDRVDPNLPKTAVVEDTTKNPVFLNTSHAAATQTSLTQPATQPLSVASSIYEDLVYEDDLVQDAELENHAPLPSPVVESIASQRRAFPSTYVPLTLDEGYYQP